MSDLNYRYLPQSIVVTFDNEIYIADETHPYWEQICVMAERGDPKVVHMFSLEDAVRDRFVQVTSRISVENRQVLLDGEPLSNPYVDRLLDVAGDEDGDAEAYAWAKFFEKLAANPNKAVAEQLGRWMKATGEDWEITEDGNFLGYRGVMKNAEGERVSKFKGTARVDGELFENTNIPNPVGATVTMPRTEVTFDPNNACAAGLHVGTKGYARSWGSTGEVLVIEVDPTNVVSVPHDAGDAKIRVCAFDIVDVLPANDRPSWDDDAWS